MKNNFTLYTAEEIEKEINERFEEISTLKKASEVFGEVIADMIIMASNDESYQISYELGNNTVFKSLKYLNEIDTSNQLVDEILNYINKKDSVLSNMILIDAHYFQSTNIIEVNVQYIDYD